MWDGFFVLEGDFMKNTDYGIVSCDFERELLAKIDHDIEKEHKPHKRKGKKPGGGDMTWTKRKRPG